jgi:hypothetical protein
LQGYASHRDAYSTVWTTSEHQWGENGGMADVMSTPGSTPGMDPSEPIPDTPAELDEPETLPAPPIEATPDDPGGDPGEEPARV